MLVLLETMFQCRSTTSAGYGSWPRPRVCAQDAFGAKPAASKSVFRSRKGISRCSASRSTMSGLGRARPVSTKPEMPGRGARLDRKVQLATPAPEPPGAQQHAARGLVPGGGHAPNLSSILPSALTSEVRAMPRLP